MRAVTFNICDDHKRDQLAVDILQDLSSSAFISILNASPNCIKIIDMDGALEFMNVNGQCSMEIDDFSSVESRQWWTLWPAESQALIQDAVQRASLGEISRIEAFCPTVKGQPRWWDVTVSPIRDAQGHVSRILSVSRDISEQYKREERLRQNEAMLQDLSHSQAAMLDSLSLSATLGRRSVSQWMNKSFSLIADLLGVQSVKAQSDETRAALQVASTRVNAIAKIQEQLALLGTADEVNLAEYLPGLLGQLREVFSARAIQLSVNVAPKIVTYEMAVSLSMIITELFANTVSRSRNQDCLADLSFKATEEGGQLTFVDNVEGGVTEPAVRYASQVGGANISIHVQQLGATFLQERCQPEGMCTQITF
ncbi:PAS domain-containing protein [Hyphomonas pacifica]|uniref:histidine kinase n=1 Tax=Hyphomonas pacifica TaxID=1280941 RepID=A0A062TWK8_9PROT|nr:PAS domain-containing protein [Hyphomonas pacifica]KCZ48696.1 hypothetical protein HY2_15845 [Hyphomonas pacifica]RAN31610.1 hypothetical protein HY3_16365 [Hyphomonas pacifica]RAN33283.1 hypothetical protein HY11_16880 [Hyphomonas pacifica]